jgi:hypothetical protein
MRCVILVVTLLAFAAAVTAAEPEVRLLAGDALRSVVEIRFPAEEAAAAVTMLAVPADARPQWRVRSVTWWREPTEAVDPAALVQTGGLAVMRGVGLFNFGVPEQAGGGAPAVVVIEVDHPAGPRTAGWLGRVDEEFAWLAEAATEITPPTMVNPEQYPRLRVASRLASRGTAKAGRATVPDWFALSSNWVRLEVKTTGAYALTGQELQDMGVTLAQVDPATLRLYRGGSWMLPEDPTVPDSLMIDRIGLTEVAITVEDEEDGSWQLTDRVLFYGFGTDAWKDRLDPAALPLETFEHVMCDAGVYWLNWEAAGETSSLPGTPLRIPTQAALAQDGVEPITQHWVRHHGEESYASVPGVVEDMFAWESSIISSLSQPFFAEAVVADAPATFVVDVRGQRTGYAMPTFRTRAWLNNDAAHADTLVLAISTQGDSLRVRLRGASTSLVTGANLIHLSYDNYSVPGAGGGQYQKLALDSFDVRYRQSLDKTRIVGALACNHWADEVASPGTPVNLKISVSPGEIVRVWDVSAPAAVRALAPTVQGNAVTVGLLRDPEESVQLLVIADADFLSVAAGAHVEVQPLRRDVGEVDYIVVTHPRFLAAAQVLAELRGRRLPGVANPAVALVTTDDIYANFSGGQKDVLAIRNFLRWNFNAHGQRLRYACLVGDASVDYRNRLGFDPESQLVDWVPTPFVNDFPLVPGGFDYADPFASDDALASFDLPEVDDAGHGQSNFDAPDIALGRLIVTTAANALEMVERIGAYDESPPEGLWRNSAVFCADDLHRPSGGDNLPGENMHTIQAEVLANQYLPASIDLEKVYLINYPLVGQYKPAARADLLNRLNAGQTVFYYVGHGSPGVLADEQVLLASDAAGLTNGNRRFVFMALSCDVGVYADPGRQCMAENFVTARDGGAIGAIAASYVSFVSANNELSSRLYAAMYPDRQTSASVAVGEALRAAKASLWRIGNYGYKRNTRRYAYLGDPGLRLPNPVGDLVFSAASMDSLLTGRPHQVLVDLATHGLVPGDGLTYDLRVEESALSRRYIGNSFWRESGNTAFRGTGPVTADPLSVPFLAPLQMRRGELGRVRLIIDDNGEERAAVLTVPVASAEVSSDDDVGPRVALSFGGGGHRVQAGTPLQAALHDTSGINVLGSNPANSLLLEFDGTGLYTDVTDRLIFAPGSYTRGRLDVPLPGDLAMGDHQVALLASDMFGNVGSDTLSFQLGAAGVTDIFDATVFPNPTPGPCRLVCEVSDPMDLQWDIYTVSGRRIRSLRENFDSAGAKILEWDGRDGEGDQIANGVYLFVLRGTSAADAGHQIRKTGQLVIMR